MTAKGAQSLSSAMGEADHYTRWIIKAFTPYFGRRMLEVGIGSGNYAGFVGDVDEYLGVDIDEALVAEAQAMHPDKQYRVLDLAAANFADEVGRCRFDTALCVNVIEHIQDDRTAVRHLLAALSTGGYLLLFVPALPALYTDLDRLAGHYRRYTKTGLLSILPEEQVEVLKAEYFNPVGGVGWWLQKFVRHTSLESERVKSQVRLFDRYVLPLSRMLNPLTRGWFGQSLVCVVRKVK